MALASTTKAQVSGHRFLQRRLHHGLVLGDVRMVHDPLRRRGRALLFGLVALALALGAAGLIALVSPDPDPRGAPIVEDDAGGLYVLLGERYHPADNLATARLAAGQPADPARIGDAVLAGAELGLPLGIPGAPGALADDDGGRRWAACLEPDGTITVEHAPAGPPLPRAAGALLAAGGREFVLDREGLRELPEAGSPAGRAVRAALGIDARAELREAPAGFLAALRELPGYRVPDPAPRYEPRGDGGVVATESGELLVTRAGREVLDALAAGGDAGPVADGEVVLPERRLRLDGGGEAICAAGPEGRPERRAEAGPGRSAELAPGDDGWAAARLNHAAPAGEAPTAGAAACRTPGGVVIVAAAGTRHAVPEPEDAQALGAGEPPECFWPALRLLPEGAELTAERAREPL